MRGIGLIVSTLTPQTKNAFVAVGIPNDPLNTMVFETAEEIGNFISLLTVRGASAFGQQAMLDELNAGTAVIGETLRVASTRDTVKPETTEADHGKASVAEL